MTCHSPLNVENCFHSQDFTVNWSWKTTISLLQCSVSNPSLSDLRNTTCDIPVYVQTSLSCHSTVEVSLGVISAKLCPTASTYLHRNRAKRCCSDLPRALQTSLVHPTKGRAPGSCPVHTGVWRRIHSHSGHRS